MLIDPLPIHDALPDILDDAFAVDGHDPRYYTKAEVNDIVEGNTFDFFLNNTNSDISAPIQYFVMDPTETGEGASTFSDTITNDAFLIDSWATSTSEPTFSALVSGIYSFHIHAETTTGANVGSVRLYWELYSRTQPGGRETLIITSEESDILVGVETEYDIHGTLATDVMLDATDRIVLKVYANIETSRPTDPLVTLTAEGTTAAHFEVVTTITAFDDRYVQVAGDTMTGNLLMGGNDILSVGNLGMTGTLTIGASTIVEDGGDLKITGPTVGSQIVIDASDIIALDSDTNITLDAEEDIMFACNDTMTLEADDIILAVVDDIFLDADDIFLELGDTAGVNKVIIQDSDSATVATIDSDGGIVGTSFTDGTMSISGGNLTSVGTIDSDDITVSNATSPTIKFDNTNTNWTIGMSGSATTFLNFELAGVNILQITSAGGMVFKAPSAAVGRVTLDALNNAQFHCDRGQASRRAEYRVETAGSLNWAFGVVDSDSFGSTGTEFFIGQTQGGANPAFVIDTNNDVDVLNDFTAGTIQADNGFTGSWVNQAGDTVTVVGGIITGVAP